MGSLWVLITLDPRRGDGYRAGIEFVQTPIHGKKNKAKWILVPGTFFRSSIHTKIKWVRHSIVDSSTRSFHASDRSSIPTTVHDIDLSG